MKSIRIFISSPGDVQEERDKAKQVVFALQHELGNDVTLLPVLWEDLAIPATASFQEGIDLVLSEKHRIDIAVFILWSRLGSALGNAITKPDGSAYQSGTEREFDLMLAAFEQSGRKTPLILAYTRDDLGAFSEKLDARTQHDEALEELLRQRKLVKQFIRERFHDDQGRNLRAYHSYREPVAFAQRLHAHLRQSINALLGLDEIAASWTNSPYRSLEVFDVQHSPIFCGRDEETCDVLQRLRDQQAAGCAFVCIVGASGSGKSSLARAGVAATLMQRAFDDGVKTWRSAIFIPGLAQGDLFNGLAQTLANALPGILDGVGGLTKLVQCFEAQNREAASILIESAFNANADTKDSKLILILDQLEELWTDRGINSEQREKLLQTIESLAHASSICVLATLRSDFYPQAQLSPAFLRMKAERGHFDLTPPGPAALHQLIVQPARRAGLHFERHPQTSRTLDQQILEDAARDPSALPILQYVLTELYERRDSSSRSFTFAAYTSLGGVEGALAKRSAQIFDKLPAEVQNALEEVLPLLISVDTVGEQNAVRRRARMTDLNSTPERKCLTEALVKARFLTTDNDASQPIATLAHEALLRHWDRLCDWVNTNRDLLRMRARLEQYCTLWEEAQRNQDYLLPHGLALAEANQVEKNAPTFISPSLGDFIGKSRRQANFKRRVLVLSLSALTLIAVAGGGIAFWKKQEAMESAKAARHAREGAENLLDSMLFDLRKTLIGLGRTDVMQRLAESAQSYYAGLEKGQITPETVRRLSMTMLVKGDALFASGRSADARPLYESVLQLAEQLAQAQPGVESSSDLAVAHNRLGDLLFHTKDFESSLSHYTSALTIREKLLATSPQDDMLRQRLATVLARMANVLTESGKAKDGLPHLLRAVTLMPDLTKFTNERGAADTSLNFDDEEGWSDPSMPFYRLGNLFERLKLQDKALEMHRKALGIRESLLHIDPSSALRKREVAWSLMAVANLQGKLGEPEARRDGLKRARALFEALLSIDSENLVWQKDFAYSLGYEADESWQRGDKGTALVLAKEAVDLWRKICSKDQDNLSLHADSHSMLGTYLTYLSQSGRDDEACSAIKSLLAELNEDKSPQKKAAKPRIAIFLTHRVLDQLNAGKKKEARDTWLECAPLVNDVIKNQPTGTYLDPLHSIMSKVPQSLQNAGWRDEAFEAYSIQLKLYRLVMPVKAPNKSEKFEPARVLSSQARLKAGAGDLVATKELLTQALDEIQIIGGWNGCDENLLGAILDTQRTIVKKHQEAKQDKEVINSVAEMTAVAESVRKDTIGGLQGKLLVSKAEDTTSSTLDQTASAAETAKQSSLSLALYDSFVPVLEGWLTKRQAPDDLTIKSALGEISNRAARVRIAEKNEAAALPLFRKAFAMYRDVVSFQDNKKYSKLVALATTGHSLALLLRKLPEAPHPELREVLELSNHAFQLFQDKDKKVEWVITAHEWVKTTLAELGP